MNPYLLVALVIVAIPVVYILTGIVEGAYKGFRDAIRYHRSR